MSLTITWERVQSQRNPDGGDLLDQATGEIIIDLVVSYDLTTGGDQTKRPIEAGAPASDHWRRRLDTASIQCMHSNTPPNSSTDITVTDVDLAGGRKAVMGTLTDGGAVSRTQGLQDELWELIRSGRLVTINGLSRVLTDWRLLNLAVTREPGRTGAMFFTLAAEEVIRSTIETVEAPSPRIERARRRRDDGGNSGGDADAPTTSERQSFLASLRDQTSGIRDSIFGGSRDQ